MKIYIYIYIILLHIHSSFSHLHIEICDNLHNTHIVSLYVSNCIAFFAGLPLGGRNYSSPDIASAASTPVCVPYKTQPSSIPLHAFMEHVAVKIRTKWRFFGIMIEIPADVLDSFPAHDCLQCFTRVFGYWDRRGQAPVSWEAVVTVLESDTVDEKRLAADIKEMFLPSLLSVPEPETKHDNSTSGRSSGYASNNTEATGGTDGIMITDV